jgi:hypothetical protein
MTDTRGARADLAVWRLSGHPPTPAQHAELRALLEVPIADGGPNCAAGLAVDASVGQDRPRTRSHRFRLLCPSLLTKSTSTAAESAYPLAKPPTAVRIRARPRPGWPNGGTQLTALPGAGTRPQELRLGMKRPICGRWYLGEWCMCGGRCRVGGRHYERSCRPAAHTAL